MYSYVGGEGAGGWRLPLERLERASPWRNAEFLEPGIAIGGPIANLDAVDSSPSFKEDWTRLE